MMDSFGQHDPGELDVFLDEISKEKSDFIVGDRMQCPKSMPFVRKMTNRFMSWIISSLAGQKIPDSQCGYRAIRREALKCLELETDRFEIESEMLLEAARTGVRIGSVPIRCVYQGEKSRINPMTDTVRFFKFLFSYLGRRRSR